MSDKYIDTIEKDGESYGIHAEDSQIKGLIQADKDIISQIEVVFDSEKNQTTFTFPKGILPIRFYCNESVYVFFNYIDTCIINEDGSIMNITLGEGEVNNVILVTSGEYHISFISELLYLGISGVIDTSSSYNWYAILNPQPAGTKLYKHTIEAEDDEGRGYEFTILSPQSSRYTSVSQLKNGNIVVSTCEEIRFGSDQFYPINLVYNSEYVGLIAYYANTAIATVLEVHTITGDTVREV